MNKLQEMIATLEADDDRGEMNDRLLEMLRKKQHRMKLLVSSPTWASVLA